MWKNALAVLCNSCFYSDLLLLCVCVQSCCPRQRTLWWECGTWPWLRRPTVSRWAKSNAFYHLPLHTPDSIMWVLMYVYAFWSSGSTRRDLIWVIFYHPALLLFSELEILILTMEVFHSTKDTKLSLQFDEWPVLHQLLHSRKYELKFWWSCSWCPVQPPTLWRASHMTFRWLMISDWRPANGRQASGRNSVCYDWSLAVLPTTQLCYVVCESMPSRNTKELNKFYQRFRNIACGNLENVMVVWQWHCINKYLNSLWH